jgi:hypothetical protein
MDPGIQIRMHPKMPWIRNTGNVTLTLPSTPSLGYDTPTTYLRHNPPLYYATLQHIAALPERGSLPLNKSGDVQALRLDPDRQVMLIWPGQEVSLHEFFYLRPEVKKKVDVLGPKV